MFGSLVLIFLCFTDRSGKRNAEETDEIIVLKRIIPCTHKHLLPELAGLSSVQRIQIQRFGTGHTFQHTEHQLLNESLA